MPLIYVAGPFRGATAWDVERNVRKAESLGLWVANHGGTPVIPHTMYRFFDGQLTGEFWLNATARILDRCDAIVMLDGWRSSQGSRAEIEQAKGMKIPIFFEADLESLAEWLERKNELP